MLDDGRLQQASDLLHELWQEGRRIASLPDHLRPTTRREGYAIQALLERRSAKPLFGWKIAATSRDGQAHLQVDGPLAGRIPAERVIETGAECPFGSNHMRVAEPEFAFRMASDLPPRSATYSMDEVMAAVGTLHPAIEVPDSRFHDFAAVGAPQLIADNACAHQFLLGPATEVAWRSVDLAEHRVIGAVRGKAEHEGKGGNVLGDPRLALTWLVNELSGLGITLRAGQVVTTGTCAAPLPMGPGDTVTADFGAFGTAVLHLSS
jgi:2-keto-4-pentenoate hydratase